MTEELPPLWALDMAAKAVGYADWSEYDEFQMKTATRDARSSCIAHARTLVRLAKHEPDIVPVDEDAEALLDVLGIWNGLTTGRNRNWKSFPAALAQFKAELAKREQSK
jgi:hypothetical protein